MLLVEGETSANANVSTTTQPTTATQQPAPTTGGALPIVSISAAATPIPLATEADLYCYGYIGDPKEALPNRVASFEDVEMTYHPLVLEQTDSVSHGDLLFIDGGTSTGLVPGETYLIVVPGDLVTHPRTGETIGRHYDYTAQVRILCADETHARAIVTQSCREVPRGARLKPMPQLPIPIARVPDVPAFCDPFTGKSNGYIVQSKGFQLIVGVGELVEINLGKDDQLQPGDFLTVYRDSPEPGQPRQVLGEIGVLTTESHTATARVVAMRRSMEVGDHVEAR